MAPPPRFYCSSPPRGHISNIFLPPLPLQLHFHCFPSTTTTTTTFLLISFHHHHCIWIGFPPRRLHLFHLFSLKTRFKSPKEICNTYLFRLAICFLTSCNLLNAIELAFFINDQHANWPLFHAHSCIDLISNRLFSRLPVKGNKYFLIRCYILHLNLVLLTGWRAYKEQKKETKLKRTSQKKLILGY